MVRQWNNRSILGGPEMANTLAKTGAGLGVRKAELPLVS